MILTVKADGTLVDTINCDSYTNKLSILAGNDAVSQTHVGLKEKNASVKIVWEVTLSRWGGGTWGNKEIKDVTLGDLSAPNGFPLVLDGAAHPVVYLRADNVVPLG